MHFKKEPGTYRGMILLFLLMTKSAMAVLPSEDFTCKSYNADHIVQVSGKLKEDLIAISVDSPLVAPVIMKFPFNELCWSRSGERLFMGNFAECSEVGVTEENTLFILNESKQTGVYKIKSTDGSQSVDVGLDCDSNPY